MSVTPGKILSGRSHMYGLWVSGVGGDVELNAVEPRNMEKCLKSVLLVIMIKI
jgi:hypothetical protein